MSHGLCPACAESLHENCGLCHNENCGDYIEEKHCEECGDELCYSCDEICHHCNTEKLKNKEDPIINSFINSFSDADDENDEFIPDKLFNKLNEEWVQKVTTGIKAVEPVMVIYAGPNADCKKHDATYTCGILVLKIHTLPPTSHTPVYRVITFTFRYGPKSSGTPTSKIIIPTGIRVSPVFDQIVGNYPFGPIDILLYVKSEIINYIYPLSPLKFKWVIKILVSPLKSNDEFDELDITGLALTSNMEVSFDLFSNYDYDYSNCE